MRVPDHYLRLALGVFAVAVGVHGIVNPVLRRVDLALVGACPWASSAAWWPPCSARAARSTRRTSRGACATRAPIRSTISTLISISAFARAIVLRGDGTAAARGDRGRRGAARPVRVDRASSSAPASTWASRSSRCAARSARCWCSPGASLLAARRSAARKAIVRHAGHGVPRAARRARTPSMSTSTSSTAAPPCPRGALGVPEHEVVKTLVMETDKGEPLIVLMHGDRKVSTKELARVAGAKRIFPCKPEVAQRHSGYLVGGTSPFGTRKAHAGVPRAHGARRCRASTSTAGGAATCSAWPRASSCACSRPFLLTWRSRSNLAAQDPAPRGRAPSGGKR